MEALTQTELAEFWGSENFYRHWQNKNMVYTDGMKHVADRAGAYWLLDIAASYQSKELDKSCNGFQVWRLSAAEGNAAVIQCFTDGPEYGGREVVRQYIEYTDWPFDTMGESFTFWVEGTGDHMWTALLPSEH